MIRVRVGRSTGITHSKADFGDKTKWALGDIDAFTRLLKSIETDILAWYDFKAEIIPTMREVESNLLKGLCLPFLMKPLAEERRLIAETRKEEIVRFSKAKADPEFSKMLKARTLGPDATETQSQLRKQIRVSVRLLPAFSILNCFATCLAHQRPCRTIRGASKGLQKEGGGAS